MRLRGAVGVEDQLEQAGTVAQVDEDQPAVIAAAVNPAGDTDLAGSVGGAQVAAPAVAVAVGSRQMHQAATSRSTRRARSTVSSVPERRSRSTHGLALDDGEEAGAEPLGLLQLPLQRAAGELHLRRQPGNARRCERLEGVGARGLEGDIEIDRRCRERLRVRGEHDPLDPGGPADAGVGGPPSCSTRPS